MSAYELHSSGKIIGTWFSPGMLTRWQEAKIYCLLFGVVRLFKFGAYAPIIFSKEDDVFRKPSDGKLSSHSARDRPITDDMAISPGSNMILFSDSAARLPFLESSKALP